jgi:hypothetical protein
MLREMLVARFREQLPESRYEEMLDRVFERELAPWEAVEMLLNGRSK